MFSCKEDDFQDQAADLQFESHAGMVEVEYRGQKLAAWKDKNGNYVVGDDIVLYRNEVNELSGSGGQNKYALLDWEQITNINVSLWPGGLISFNIGPGFTNAELVMIDKAIQHWNNKTRIIFIRVPVNEKVYFKKVDSGCRAGLGYPENGEKNIVQVSPSCDLQSIIHELGHVVGLNHEHQKSSRNGHIIMKPETFNFIESNYHSIYQTLIENFRIEETNLGDPFPFDIQSVMMYGSYPRNNIALRDLLISQSLPFFTKKDGSIVERPLLGLSPKDIMLVQYYYTRKLILRNIDYNVVRVKMRTEGSDPDIMFLNPEEEIMLYYDSQKDRYTYNGHVVQQLGLNNGNDVTNYIKLSWSGSNDIKYFVKVSDPMDSDGSMILIKDYVHPENTAYYHFTNRDGIDGGSRKAIVESQKIDDYTSCIYLKRWNSDRNTDRQVHSFNKYTPATLKIRNINYPALENIVMKFTGCSDKKIALAPGQSIALEYTANGFTYGGCKLRQLDFNNGNSSDDLNFSQSSYLGEVTYQGSSSYITTIIDTNSGYIYGAVDPDGIDGKVTNAQLVGYTAQGTMFIDIRK
ncbi:M12 family metallopeptidase [Chryseobacterium sp. CBSDS_008]|uniref:M12 family metallopeptidase n=1 Tax=Chryseobacterium sp. CBSDS_008 TaxID=3415265 RepID=UPI003CED3613